MHKIVCQTWKHHYFFCLISRTKSIETFENSPDDGIFGKTFSRILNRLWNYGVVGLIGTPLCFIGHPMLVVLNTIISALGLITSPVWAPIIGLFRYLCQLFVYDFDSSSNVIMPLPAAIYKCFVKGLGQMLLSLGAIIGHGFVGGVVCSYGLLSYSVRHIYDASMYHFILKHLAFSHVTMKS